MLVPSVTGTFAWYKFKEAEANGLAAAYAARAASLDPSMSAISKREVVRLYRGEMERYEKEASWWLDNV